MGVIDNGEDGLQKIGFAGNEVDGFSVHLIGFVVLIVFTLLIAVGDFLNQVVLRRFKMTAI